MFKKQVIFVCFLVLVIVLAGCSLDKTVSNNLTDLKVDGTTVTGFYPNVKTYFVTLPVGSTQIPVVTATPENAKADVSISAASGLPGISMVKVVNNVGEVKTYNVCFTVANPDKISVQSITLHRSNLEISKDEAMLALKRGDVCRLLAKALNLSYKGTPSPFPDVTSAHQYFEEIMACFEEGIVKGYEDGTFQPHGVVTRAEFATVLAKSLGYSIPANQAVIADLSGSHWSYNFVNIVLDAGLMELFDNGTFKPDDNYSTKLEGTLIPIIAPKDACVKKVCFSSADESIVRVNQTGQLTGLKPGSTIVTAYSLDGTVQKSSVITVTASSK